MTPGGTIYGKVMSVTEQEEKEAINLLCLAAEEGTYFKLEANSGFYVLPKEMIRDSIFFLEDV